MAATPPLRLAPEWDERFVRMVLVSAAAHCLVFGAFIVFAARMGPRPLPLVAYTVELTDPSALGGRLPPGAPGADLRGGAEEPPAPAAPPSPPAAPAAPPEPAPAPAPEAVAKPEVPEVRIAEKAPPKPEPKPEPKKAPDPQPEAKKPEARKPETKKAEPKKPEPTPAPRAAEAKTPTKSPAPAKAAEAKGTAATAGPAADAAPRDAYAASAERWRSRAGGGLGGTDEGSGPVGAGGSGPGGGGQLVGLDFLAYRQQVINTIKARWTNVVGRPGLVAKVYFEIAPDGEVSGIRLHQSSGNTAYDASALRAVQHAGPLAPPPARYQKEFREFVVEFHSEEPGGQGTG